MKLEEIIEYLQRVTEREVSADKSERAEFALKYHKKQAVRFGNHSRAKAIWLLEQILKIQNNYIQAFELMKNEQFYEAWCKLERVEIDLISLEKHYNLNDDIFGIEFIKKHTEQFQSLFPYKLFASPEMIKLEMVCSICNRRISIRKSCGHQVGEIYRGRMCGRIITKVKFIGLALTENPTQRYSVMFITKEGSNEQVDNYNYSSIAYVVNGLMHPFAAWEMIWTKTRHPHSRFEQISPEDDCPCGSDKAYQDCCLNEIGVLRPHLKVLFHEQLPENYPQLIYSD